MEKRNFYIIDSCSLVDLNKHSPIDVFPGLWRRIANLINSDMMISHIEVFNEVTQQDDVLAEWIKRHKKMFKKVTLRQSEIVREILKRYPSFVKKDSKYDADPWLVALAKEVQENPQQNLFFKVKRLVVTEESLKGNKINSSKISAGFSQ